MREIDRILDVFGSQAALAEATGVGPSAISNWKRWGAVPASKKWLILNLARERGLPLEPEDLGLPPANRTAPDSRSAA